MDYKNLNDYELIYQVRENDEVAYGMLVEKYSNLVSIFANKFFKNNKNIGLDYEDLYQEGMLGLIKALNNYNPNDTLFYTYAMVCIKREIDRAIKAQKRKKHMILNESLSINKMLKNDSNFSMEKFLASDFNMEKEYETFETYEKAVDAKYEIKDLLDSSIYELKVNGFSTREIANLLDLTYKAVDYRMRKIRKKIENFVY